MSWEQKLLERCAALNMEPAPVNQNPFDMLKTLMKGPGPGPDGQELVLICPKIPSRKEKTQLQELVPDGFKLRYEEGIKISSMNAVASVLGQYGYQTKRPDSVELGRRVWTIVATGGQPGVDSESLDLDRIHDVLIKDGYLDQWTIRINDEVVGSYNPRIANELTKNNSIRENIIQQDDITNLKITLENCKTVDELLELI